MNIMEFKPAENRILFLGLLAIRYGAALLFVALGAVFLWRALPLVLS